MKVLDVNEFQQGLERTVNQLTRLESEMKQIESAVQGLTQLEESLKGQGGEALRAYYESCHLPFLTFFNTFKISFTIVLQEMKTALSSLEPDSSGFIRQAALEGEIEQGLNRAKQVTEELTDEANNIMDQVSDIVSLPKLDDSEVHLGVHDAKRHRDETVEKLIEFDVSQTDALTTIQTDLMHMKTWITNIETMMTEGVTDVNFPAEQWQSFASQNPLMIALAYRTQSLDQVINMNPLFNPGGIGGANPYTLPGLYQNGQQPLGTFGLSGAMVSTNFVSFMKQQEKEIVKELSTTATTVDNVKEDGNGFLNFLGDVGSGATKVGKGLLDFLILDDVNTLADKNASGLDKGIALASFIPIGKVLKIPKAIDKIVDSNVGEVVKKSNVDEVVGKGADKGKGVSETNLRNIDDFINGNKKFDEIIEDYAKVYKEHVDLNKPWSWDDTIPGGDSLSSAQKRKIKEMAIAKAHIPEIKITKADGMRYGFADFASAGVVEETVQLPDRFWKLSDKEQFKWLDEQIGGTRKGMTWHHTEVPGKMELVPFGIHNITPHNGGRTKGMWADAPR
ncbi:MULTISPECIES: T7SS effector LXG polymorphic toxin [Solibacillus]|uniref:HNH endonuclease n=1 Tax=Solibacillus merdavium TaxID=2762218 RepID=A0ABR8XJW1_9BACL|nr:T7SS effector LXG polymorphic toxin [Solibacillus merdavium]MBD8032197.1 HNH endonuclease [Solibacillus merdavium]